MHKARHTAGQRLLDATGNLKAVQKLLGHTSIQTTDDVYIDWDVEQLAASLPRRCRMSDLQSFRTESWGTRMVEPIVEAAGIEPASAAVPTERLRA